MTTSDRPPGVPDVKSLPAYYVLVVAGHAHAAPRDEEPLVVPTLSRRLRTLISGLRPSRPARPVPLEGHRPA